MKFSKKNARLKRARRFRIQNKARNKIVLSVHKSAKHIYAQVIDVAKGRTLTSASSLAAKLDNSGNIKAATEVGRLIAKATQAKDIRRVVFDRSGFKFHGRIKALAESARAEGLEF